MSKQEKYKPSPTEKVIISALSVFALFLFFFLSKFVFFPDAAKSEEDQKKMSLQKTVLVTDTLYKSKTDSTYTSLKTTTNTESPVTTTALTVKERLDSAYLYFVLVFGAMLLLLIFPRIIKFSIGKDGISGEFSENEKKAINNATGTANMTPRERTGGKNTENPDYPEERKFLFTANNADDPNKGLWGGLNTNNQRTVKASFVSSEINKNWVKVTLEVSSTDPVNDPLEDYVLFHMHPSFPDKHVKKYVIKGLATYSFNAWGAFTVGIETDKGENFLELDLSELPDAPSPFKER
jgi:hypothetical protein